MSAWPAPDNPEHLFAKALLIHGPLPPKGWYVTRRPDGSVTYIVARSLDARAFQRVVIAMFMKQVDYEWGSSEFSDHRIEMVARSWKNLFLKWIWEKIDEA